MALSRNKTLLLSFVLGSALLSGCAHAVRVISVPEGANISINGQNLGQAPLLYRERSGPPGRARVIKAELAGHAPMIRKETVRICPTPANLIADSLFAGFFWGFCMRDEYIVDFTQAAKR
jgi:hypothetical protein